MHTFVCVLNFDIELLDSIAGWAKIKFAFS